MLRKILLATAFAASLAGAAQAAPIAFTSDGGFQNLGNTTTGIGCLFTACAAITNGGNVLDMSGGNNSTLTANDFSFSGTTDLNDQRIGEITWVNRPSTSTDPSFTVQYVLNLIFSQPNVDTANQNFNLTIQQPTNPPGDSVSGLTIAGLPSTFSLNGVTVSDFRFSIFSGAGSTFNNGVWFNPEGGTSVLRLTADFNAVSVPEPASIALLGAGLLGLGFVRRKRNQGAA